MIDSIEGCGEVKKTRQDTFREPYSINKMIVIVEQSIAVKILYKFNGFRILTAELTHCTPLVEYVFILLSFTIHVLLVFQASVPRHAATTKEIRC